MHHLHDTLSDTQSERPSLSTPGDSLTYHAGMKFSTKDVDNDLWKEDSCAVHHKGGWWYKGCDSRWVKFAARLLSAA